ncbi:MAG: DUF1801 domain-containing protein [Phycisphaerae bacterium]|nr:DUF1801 domain-containing protein [Saprospiraceae bacterium]
MTYNASTPSEYINAVDEGRREAFSKLRDTISENIPADFQEQMCYNMISYVVPHELYPPGYHVDPKVPLGLVAIAAQKNFIALYHMGVYTMPELLDWFVREYPKHCKGKLDMGKSCIRFKKPEEIPYALIAQLMQKVSVDDWVECYESNIKR